MKQKYLNRRSVDSKKHITSTPAVAPATDQVMFTLTHQGGNINVPLNMSQGEHNILIKKLIQV